jgi:hypothetical protein
MSTTSQPCAVTPSITAFWIDGALLRMSRPTTSRFAFSSFTSAAPIRHASFSSISVG